MKKFYLFLAVFAVLSVSSAFAQELVISANQSYQITNKSSELEIEVFINNPGLSFTSVTFSVTNPVGVYFYGASTFDPAYHWTYIKHDDSVRYRNSGTDFYKVRKPFVFATDGRVVGSDSGFVLKLHFKIDQPSVYPAGDTLVIWLSSTAAFNGVASVPIQPVTIGVYVPFGKKAEDPDPQPKDSVNFEIVQLQSVTPASSEVAMRFYVFNPGLAVSKVQYQVQIPKGMSYSSVDVSTEADGYAYTGQVVLDDSGRNSCLVTISAPGDNLYLKNSQDCYLDLHCAIDQPTDFQVGDTASFMYSNIQAWQADRDTLMRHPVKYPVPNFWNMFVKKTVIFEGVAPQPTDSVSFTIEQLGLINVDSDKLNLRVNFINPGYDLNKYEFAIRMPQEFHPVGLTTVPDSIGAEYMFNNSTPNGLEYYFIMYQNQDNNSFGRQAYMDIELQIEKPHSYQTGDTVNFTIFIVDASKMTVDTLIEYPIKGYQAELYDLAYKLPVVFVEGSSEPDTADLFFERWVDDENHFWPENKEVIVFLKRNDLIYTWTKMNFDIIIQSRYAILDEFHLDGMEVADNVELQASDTGAWVSSYTTWEYDDVGNYVAIVDISALGMMPNQVDNNPANFLKFLVRYRDVYSEEFRMTLGNITAQTAEAGVVGKTEKIMALLNLDPRETVMINLVEAFRKLLLDPNDVNDDGIFDVRDVALALDMAEGKIFGNLKARLAADAAEPYNREIDYNDYLALLKRLNITDVADYDPINLSNYPNPVDYTTTIYFNLPFNGEVNLELYDLLGQKIKTLANGYYNAGNQSLQLDCSELPTGTYTYVLKVGNVQKVQRLLVK